MTFTKTDTPRETVTIIFRCFAPPELIGEDWEDLTPEAQQWHTDNKALPCEGRGGAWSGCAACQFGDSDYGD